ncbi:hypothetical protein J2Y60_000828 [Arcicella sp. BE140]|nr:hypothetical protein [Arcicella sp. BE51]MDR6810643.1 hypothetical protein [Arcicella sp. BE140]MDR6821993.1 hypothetical protein [Arcicella sp. BE139]
MSFVSLLYEKSYFLDFGALYLRIVDFRTLDLKTLDAGF